MHVARRPRYRPLKAKSGCLTCRQRRKKCDERRPICEMCARLNHECTWPTPTSTALSRTSTTTHVYRDAPGHQPARSPLAQRFMREWGHDSFEGKLFQYFTEQFFPRLTRPHMRPGFSRIYSSSLAQHKRPLTNAILACSAIHLSEHCSQFKDVGMIYYAASFSALRKEMNPQSVESIKDWFVWQAIYLCLFERWNTDQTSNPVPHSLAALEFFNISLAKSQQLESQYYMINILLYNTALLSLFRGQSVQNSIIDRLPPLYHSAPLPETPHWASPLLFKWMSAISHLSHRTPLSPADEAQAIELRISLNNYSVSTLSTMISKSHDSIQQKYAALSSRMFIVSAQILLSKLLDPDISAEHLIIHSQVADALALIQYPPQGTRFDQAFCWPFLVVGFAVVEDEHVESMRSKLTEMWHFSFCGDVNRVTEVLEKVWKFPVRGGQQMGYYQQTRFDMLLQKEGLFDAFLGKPQPR